MNPLAETDEKLLIAADAKLNFDDNAEYRQRELFALRDHSQEDPREVAAGKLDLNYIGLDGYHRVHGQRRRAGDGDDGHHLRCTAAVSGELPRRRRERERRSRVVEAFKIHHRRTSKVKALLVNIFGGIMKCDVIADGHRERRRQGGGARRSPWSCASRARTSRWGRRFSPRAV